MLDNAVDLSIILKNSANQKSVKINRENPRNIIIFFSYQYGRHKLERCGWPGLADRLAGNQSPPQQTHVQQQDGRHQESVRRHLLRPHDLLPQGKKNES